MKPTIDNRKKPVVPYVSLLTEDRIRIRNGGPCGEVLTEATAKEVYWALKEYDALNAVADAGQMVTERWDMFRRGVAESIEVVGMMNALKDALANLSAIRAKEGK